MIGIILAGGKSQRFNSEKSKVLHELCGKPLLFYSIENLKKLKIKKMYIVVGGKSKKEIIQKFKKDACIIDQKIPLGTGDAVKKALEEIKENDDLLILPGDAPLLRYETLKKFIDFYNKNKPDALILTALFENPEGYGRIIKKNSRVLKIVEEIDANDKEKNIKEVNTGVYIFKRESLEKVINKIKPDNKKGEYYLTDCIHLLNYENKKILAFEAEDPDECIGINKREDFIRAFKIMKERIIEKITKNGVTIFSPENVYIDYDVEIGKDTIIYPFVVLKGKTKIGKNCEIGPFVYIKDKIIEDGKKVFGGEKCFYGV
jgi:bifunctional UDP-N-acetylglucosamine pyrophosphorylase/glucosamine-1-phosphate N-acetyltransferase